jgi:hypothetical protein
MAKKQKCSKQAAALAPVVEADEQERTNPLTKVLAPIDFDLNGSIIAMYAFLFFSIED